MNSQQIEDRIDRQAAGAIALRPASGGMMTIAPTSMGELFEFAKLMAVSRECVRKVFRDNPGACLAIALQAFRTGADPFAVANKAYLVNDQIAYEAQYIHAVINTSGILKRRLRATYEGVGPNLCCLIRGEIHGEDEPLEYRSPPIGNIPVKNSPLWKSDPEQQLFYYSSRAWVRRYAPEVLLGMDTGEDIESRAIDVTPPPKPQREDFADPANESEAWFLVVDGAGQAEEFEYPIDAVEAVLRGMSDALRSRGAAGLEAVWESNEGVLVELRERDLGHLAENVEAHHAALLAETRQSSASADDPSKGAEGDASASSASSPSEPPAKRHRATKAEMAERRRVHDELSSAHHDRLEQDAHIAGVNRREREGYDAFKEGRPASLCTYPLNSSEREDWHRGWTKAFSETIPDRNPERATGADPTRTLSQTEDRAPEARAADDESVGEPVSRQSAAAEPRPDGPVRLETRANPESAGEAGGSPVPGPTDLVGQLTAKLTAAAEQGIREFHKAWLGLSAHERDLARPMRAQYEQIAQGVRA